MVSLEGVSFTVGKKVLVKETTASFTPNHFHVIMGANGAGKSTLLKLMSGYLKPFTGHVYLQQKNIHQYSQLELATKRAVLSQHYDITFPITVRDVVLMGRYPYYKSVATEKDRQLCDEAMHTMRINNLAEREYTTLSGGEAQKTQMSRVLAQIGETNSNLQKVLFLDEPVSHLDVKYQYQLLHTAKDLCKKNVTVIAILHDINLALHFADRILFMKDGAVRYDLDHPKEVTPHIIKDIFDITATIEMIRDKTVVLF